MIGTRPDDPNITVSMSKGRRLFYGKDNKGDIGLESEGSPYHQELPANGVLNLKFLLQISYGGEEYLENLGGVPVRLIYRPGISEDCTQFKYIDARVHGIVAPPSGPESMGYNLVYTNLTLPPGSVSLYLYELGEKKSVIESGKSAYAVPPGYSETLTSFPSCTVYDTFFKGTPPIVGSVHPLGAILFGSLQP